jgi:hypothetical protein
LGLRKPFEPDPGHAGEGTGHSMQKSLIIARLIGPVLSAIGIGMLVNQPTYREMAAQFVGGLPSSIFPNSGAGRRTLYPQCP